MANKEDQKAWFDHARGMWRQNAQVLSALEETVNEDQYIAVLDAILNCNSRVATLGMGTSSVAARKIAHMLCVANVPSFFVSAGDAAHGALGAVQSGDVLIVISKGGNTEELVNLITPIKGKGLKLITVTQNEKSRLAKAADIVLLLKTEESDHLHRLPTASILSIISIFDAISDELTRYSQFSDEIFYLNHNHGSVGADLKRNNKKK
jgi:D-arabinose 5-phosphate isomerase GutQ